MFSRLGAGIAILTLSAGPILVAAQYDIPALPSVSLSDTCTNTLKGILNSTDAACLNPSAFLQYAVLDQSIPKTVDNWLEGVCTTGACSDESIASVITTVVNSCSGDIYAYGISASTDEILSTVIPIVQKAYPTVRKVACLQQSDTAEYCVTKTLNDIESVIGKLDVSDLQSDNLNTDVQGLLSAGIQNVACSSCAKEAYTIANKDFPDIVNKIQDEAQQLCGADFVDGQTAEGITETETPGLFSASQKSTGGNTDGAEKLGSLAGSVLVALSFGLFVL